MKHLVQNEPREYLLFLRRLFLENMTIKEIQLLFIIVADTPVPLVIDVPSLLLYEGQESLLSVVVSCM